MINIKRVLAIAAATMLSVSSLAGVPVHAVDAAVNAKLYGRVEDNGQAIYKAVIDYDNVKVVDPKVEDFTVHVKATTEGKRDADDTAYGDFDKDRKIVKVESKGNQVEIYFDEADGAAGTLSYLAKGARNIPSDIIYTITQNNPLALTSMDGRELGSQVFEYKVDNTVYDDEVAKFKSIKVDNGINYQFYDAGKDADSLIVWFHGNGEGDYRQSGNNIAQVLANRGTVAWATDEAQSIFGKSHVMAFQAPDTWYYANKDNLLEKAYNEIQEVVSQKGVNPKKIYVSGCSAGGYMTTRMLIKYPNYFKAAMINCPALDVASKRGGETPTDEELESLLKSSTAIWLVQGENDGTVNTDDCAARIFDTLIGTQEIKTTRVDQELDSGFTTYETPDNKYKLTLYDTTDTDRSKAKLKFGEDFDQDGVKTQVEFSNHWSWIYTLRNNPKAANGDHIWNWAANYKQPSQEENKPTPTPEPKPTQQPEQKPTNNQTPTQKPETKQPTKASNTKTTTKKAVKTGDATIVLPFVLLVIIGLAGMLVFKKRHN